MWGLFLGFFFFPALPGDNGGWISSSRPFLLRVRGADGAEVSPRSRFPFPSLQQHRGSRHPTALSRSLLSLQVHGILTSLPPLPPPPPPPRAAPRPEREERGWGTPGACWPRQSRATASRHGPVSSYRRRRVRFGGRQRPGAVRGPRPTGFLGRFFALGCFINKKKTMQNLCCRSVPLPGGARPGLRVHSGATTAFSPRTAARGRARPVPALGVSGYRSKITRGTVFPDKRRLFYGENIPGLFV